MSESISQSKKNQIVIDEKGYSGVLATIGKISYFSEYFDNKEIEESFIEKVIPVEKPKEKRSYKFRYEMAKALVEQGFSKENYHEFMLSINKKIKHKVENIINQGTTDKEIDHEHKIR